MIQALGHILQQSWDRLGVQMGDQLPNVLALLLILVAGWVTAVLARWAVRRMGSRLETSCRHWGLVSDHYGQTTASELLSRGVFWLIFGAAILVGINALNTEMGSLLVTGILSYLPRLLTAGLVILAGLLLGRFLARGVLIWAVNEGLEPARWIANAVRIGVGLLTVVAAAEQLAIARTAILATFVILLSGAVLGVALAVGIGSRKRVEEWLDQRAALLKEQKHEQPIEHL